MTTNDIVLHIFCVVGEHLPDIPWHPEAKLYKSELVRLALCLLSKAVLFGPSVAGWNAITAIGFEMALAPERTRSQRLLKTHQGWCQWLMACGLPSLLNVLW